MIDIEKLADEFFEFPDENNKQYVTFFSAKLFAEAYHEAMCEVEASSTEVATRQLKRLSDEKIIEIWESKRWGHECKFANAIMDEMERVNK